MIWHQSPEEWRSGSLRCRLYPCANRRQAVRNADRCHAGNRPHSYFC